VWEDSEGNPLLNEDRQQVTSAKLIDTKKLLSCQTPEAVTAFFLEMTSAAVKLWQARNAKNKRQAAAGMGASTSGTLSGNVSPSPSIEITHERFVREDDLEDTSSRKHPKVDTVSGSRPGGPHRLHPGVPAGNFVLPLAFGHSPLFS
ncbi:hypothetical protein A2U01_0038993, partial [Trifolium medium]|nr:hypothetical protein [Trifolium medium]